MAHFNADVKLFCLALAVSIGALLVSQSATADCVDSGGFTNPSGIIDCTGVTGGLGQITTNYHLVDFVDMTVHDGAVLLGGLRMLDDHDGRLLNNGTIGVSDGVTARTPVEIIGDWAVENNGLIVYGGERLVGSGGFPISGAGSAIQLFGENTIINTGSIVTTSNADLAEGIFTIPLGTIWNTQTGSIETGGFRSDGIAAIGLPDTFGATIGAIVNDGTIQTTGDRSAGMNLLWQGDILNNGQITASGLRPAGIVMTGGSFGEFFREKIDDVAWEIVIEPQVGPTPTIQGILGFFQDNDIEIPPSWFLLPDEQYAAGSVSNNGSVTVTGDAAEGPAHGIVILGTQNGMINNNGSVEVSGQDAAGLGLLGQGTITNELNGTIHASGIGAEGISAEAIHDTDLIEIESRGPITVDGDEWVVGIGVTADDASIALDGPEGTIAATGRFATGIEALGDRADITSSGGGIKVTGDFAAGIEALGDGVKISSSAGTLDLITRGIEVEGEDSAGIWVTGDDADITSSGGGIKVTGDFAAGIGIEGDSGRIANLRLIDMQGDASPGIYILGDGVHASNGVVGRILTDGSSSDGVQIQGDAADVINSGWISTRGFNADGIAIGGDGCLGVAGGCRIDNQGTVSTLGSFSDGIAVSGDKQNIANGGLISTRGMGAEGIVLDATASGRILNEGTIQTDGEGARGILALGDGLSILNAAGATISTAAAGAHGIALGLSGDSIKSHGTVFNEGIIETTGYGADGIHAFADSSEITNLNSIRTTVSEAAGIRAIGDGVEIVNGRPLGVPGAASIATDGDSAHGIVVAGRDAKVNNFGSIETFGNEASAVKISGETGAQLNLRTGTLVTHGNSSHGIEVAGNGAIVFSGAEITTEGSGAHGISFEGNAASGVGNVANFSSITTRGGASNGLNVAGDGLALVNSGHIVTEGPISHGIAVSGNNVDVLNEGDVAATELLSAAVRLQTQLGQTVTLNNTGTLTAAKSRNAVLGGAGTDRVVNSGTVDGDILLGAGDDVLELASVNSSITGISDGGIGEDHLIWSAGHLEPLQGDRFLDFDRLTSGSFVGLTGNFETSYADLLGGEIVVDGHFTTAELRMNNGDLTLSPGSVLTADVIDIGGGPAGDKCDLGACLLLDNARINSSDGDGLVFVGVGGSLVGTGVVEVEKIEIGGYIQPGLSPGLLTIDGDLLFKGGFLEIEIGGTGFGEFDVLEVTGIAEFLGGEVLFSFIDEFLPTPDDLFDFLVADSILGFDNLSYSLFGLPSSYGADVFATASGLKVSFDAAASVPEPGTLGLMIVGLAGLGTFARRRRSGT